MAYYGAGDGTPGLGVLGHYAPDTAWQRLAEQGAAYQGLGKPVQLAFELIATVADAVPGPSGDYRSRQDASVMTRYLAEVRRHHGLLILDIQPGRSDFLTEAKALQPWLSQPDVGLALDPEWRMGPGEIPGQVIGSVSAEEINEVSAWLDQLTASRHLPRKVFLLHKFREQMITDESTVVSRPHLYGIENMDGFGGQEIKIREYQEFSATTPFAMGIKLFYKQDTDRLTPAEAVKLHPTPVLIDYQ